MERGRRTLRVAERHCSTEIGFIDSSIAWRTMDECRRAGDCASSDRALASCSQLHRRIRCKAGARSGDKSIYSDAHMCRARARRSRDCNQRIAVHARERRRPFATRYDRRTTNFAAIVRHPGVRILLLPRGGQVTSPKPSIPTGQRVLFTTVMATDLRPHLAHR
jgi:hypothetical protein